MAKNLCPTQAETRVMQARRHTENIQSEFSTLSGIVIVLF